MTPTFESEQKQQRPKERRAGFNELGAATQRSQKKEFQREFERTLQGKVGEVVPGKFEVPPHLKEAGIDLVLVRPFKAEGRNYVTIAAVPSDIRNGTATMRIDEQGQLSSAGWPRYLRLSREQMAIESIRLIEQSGLSFWYHIDREIVSEQDEAEIERQLMKAGLETKESKRGAVDPKRLEFLRTQPKALYGVVGTEGFRGYHVIVFSHSLIFENPEIGNAAFIINLPKPIPVDSQIYARPAESRLNKDERQRITSEYVDPIISGAKTKGQLRSDFSAIRIIHSPDPATWTAKMQSEIESRLAGKA